MRALVVEDEEKVAGFISKGLEECSYNVDVAGDGEEALDYISTNTYDVIILDLMLPKRDGLSVVKELRSQGKTVPVLALTAKSSVEDRILGLDSGCDDYLAKPFSFEELLARLRAIHRRQVNANRGHRLEFHGLTLDPVTREVSRDGRSIELTNKEFALLELLMRHPGQVYTRTAILQNVWGYDFDASSNVLEVYMNFLRKKLDPPGSAKLLHTVRGVGYVLREESK